MKQIKYFILALMLISIVAIIAPAMAVNAEDYNSIDIVLLNQDPDPAGPGDYVELRWKVTKEGLGVINNLSFKLDTEYPLSLDKSDTAVKSLGSLVGYTNKDEYYTLYYRVLVDSGALEGNYDLNVNIIMDSMILSKTFTIRVADSKNPELVSGIIRTEPIKLMPDTTDNKLSVELLNLGEDDAELVVAELSLPDGFENTYSYSSISSLGTIAGGSSKIATFYIDTSDNIEEKEYPTFLILKYREEGENVLMTKKLPVSLEVKNKPMFQINDISFEPTVINAGDTVTMKVTLQNVGSKDSESISLRAFKESSQPFDFDEKSDFIGTLKPGQEGTAVIVFTVVDTAASKEYLMDLEVRSIYNGDVFTQQDVAKVDVLAKKSNFFSRYWIAILVVIAAILIVGYLTIKRK